jgi:hypothetical protein
VDLEMKVGFQEDIRKAAITFGPHHKACVIDVLPYLRLQVSGREEFCQYQLHLKLELVNSIILPVDHHPGDRQ